eukprot:CAMPEP_0118894452 /NCGR_PEP_ID=MMETSP1166-20130328/3223_1 /TAXON_ID=1104430 /ORGANISM="Chrysoreinhardia sp, Strain CCMP3193" /LENGTH=179 /DNA_ID=CAMNT_0006833361 /DNA_START=104 /DNA_END=643 /DNA_ORIENTATION=+
MTTVVSTGARFVEFVARVLERSLRRVVDFVMLTVDDPRDLAGQKHTLSEEYLAGKKERRKRSKGHACGDIEDVPSLPKTKSQVVVSQESMLSDGSAATDVYTASDDSCPGFFPTCGSGVSCDECTSKNRDRVLDRPSPPPKRPPTTSRLVNGVAGNNFTEPPGGFVLDDDDDDYDMTSF